MTSIEELIAKVFVSISLSDDTITFNDHLGPAYALLHHQDCCEHVYIEDVVGDLVDLIGYPILKAEESSNSSESGRSGDDSFTWTFYRISTIKGGVTIRFYGSSNGYYSEDAQLVNLREKK